MGSPNTLLLSLVSSIPTSGRMWPKAEENIMDLCPISLYTAHNRHSLYLLHALHLATGSHDHHVKIQPLATLLAFDIQSLTPIHSRYHIICESMNIVGTAVSVLTVFKVPVIVLPSFVLPEARQMLCRSFRRKWGASHFDITGGHVLHDFCEVDVCFRGFPHPVSDQCCKPLILCSWSTNLVMSPTMIRMFESDMLLSDHFSEQ